MHHLIFVPGAKMNASEKLLIAVGLPDFIAGHEVAESAGPPDGQPGALLFWRRPGEGNLIIEYNPDRQTWKPAVPIGDTIPGGRYYVGIDNDRRPTEFDVRRPVQFRGHRIQLCDGGNWLLPTPRELPAEIVLTDEGKWDTEPMRQFQSFTIAAFEWLELLAGIPADAEVDIDFDHAVGFVVQALRLNYRITPELVSMLKLLSSDMITPAIYAASGLLSSAGQMVEG